MAAGTAKQILILAKQIYNLKFIILFGTLHLKSLLAQANYVITL